MQIPDGSFNISLHPFFPSYRSDPGYSTALWLHPYCAPKISYILLVFHSCSIMTSGTLSQSVPDDFFKMVPALVTAVPGRWWCWEGHSFPLRYHSSLCSPIVTSRQPISIFRAWPFPSFMNTGNQLQTYSQHPQLSLWLLTWSSKEAGVCGWRPCASAVCFILMLGGISFPFCPFLH